MKIKIYYCIFLVAIQKLYLYCYKLENAFFTDFIKQTKNPTPSGGGGEG